MPKPIETWTSITRFVGITNHESKAAAYEYVANLARRYKAGTLRPEITRVTIFCDDGFGKQEHARIRLADYPTI